MLEYKHEAKEKHGGGGNREVAIFEHAEIDDGILDAQFPDHAGDHADEHEDSEEANKIRGEPVFALALVQDDLHAAEAEADEAKANVVDAKAFLQVDAFHVWRIGDEEVGERQGNQANWNVDVEDPAPGIIVCNETAEPGTDGGRDDDGDSVHGESHAALRNGKCVVEDGLLAGLQAATTDTLEDAENHQHAEAGGESAEERADGENGDANHVEALAANHRGKPARERQDDCIGNEIRSQNPSGLIGAGGKISRDVRKRDVGDGSVEHFHKRGERDDDGDHPRVDRAIRHAQLRFESVQHSGESAPFNS